MDAFWVFGYGSLMWQPGFACCHAQPCRLFGYHRRLCIYSRYYRGTPEHPGLVLGLARGGSCSGIAYYVEKHKAQQVYDYLIAREMHDNVYFEKRLPLHLQDGRKVSGIAFVANPAHECYASTLSHEAVCAIVATARGATGSTADYVRNTIEHLREAGMPDKRLEAFSTQCDGRLMTKAATTPMQKAVTSGSHSGTGGSRKK